MRWDFRYAVTDIRRDQVQNNLMRLWQICRRFCPRFRARQRTKQSLRFSHFNLTKEYHLPVCKFCELNRDLPLPQGPIALSQSLPLLGNRALSLEPWTASMRTSSITMDSLATVAAASVTSTWPVLLARPMDQDSGSQNTRCFAQQKAVAARVSGGEKT